MCGYHSASGANSHQPSSITSHSRGFARTTSAPQSHLHAASVSLDSIPTETGSRTSMCRWPRCAGAADEHRKRITLLFLAASLAALLAASLAASPFTPATTGQAQLFSRASMAHQRTAAHMSAKDDV